MIELDWLKILPIAASAIGTVVVAIATVVLCRVTHSLYVQTKRLADISSQPHIVATLEPNPWAIMWTNFRVQNTGNATAYDIEIDFTPPLDDFKAKNLSDGVAFQRVSALKPGQEIVTAINETDNFLDKTFNVTTSWRRTPKTGLRETNSYVLNFNDYKGFSQIGPADPLVKIADSIEGIRQDWQSITRGWKSLKVDTYGLEDRSLDAKQRAAWVSEAKEESLRPKTQTAPTPPNQATSDDP